MEKDRKDGFSVATAVPLKRMLYLYIKGEPEVGIAVGHFDGFLKDFFGLETEKDPALGKKVEEALTQLVREGRVRFELDYTPGGLVYTKYFPV